MYSFSEAKKIINGQLVQDIAVKTEYNGKTLHVDKMNNNTFSHNIIQDKDLAKLMQKTTNKRGLWEQLTMDYLGDQHKHKHSKHRHSKHRHRHSHSNHTKKHKKRHPTKRKPTKKKTKPQKRF
jgi:hypothetical protein